MSAKPTDGGPAFPVEERFTSGMSLRDWFAGQALAGGVGKGYGEARNSAFSCYKLADAMLEERERKGDSK